MNKQNDTRPPESTVKKTAASDLEFNSGTQTLPDDTFNNNLSARPKADVGTVDLTSEDSIEESLDFGEMNVEDAVASGYTDKEGHAISKAKEDVVGSPTGAYTDIGAGRSSAVHHVSKDEHH